MIASRIENPPRAIYRSLEATTNPALRGETTEPTASRAFPGFASLNPGYKKITMPATPERLIGAERMRSGGRLC
jgi:hypothetical protein